MKDDTSLKLVLTNDSALIPVALDAVTSFATRIGFVHPEIDQIKIAVEEGCLNIVKHAFEPGEVASYSVQMERTPRGILLTLHDDGLPYVPTQEESDDVGAHLGTRLMKGLTDSYVFKSLGVGGKELLLEKYLPAPSVADQVSVEEIRAYQQSEQAAEAQQAAGEVPPARIPRTVRLLNLDDPDELLDVSRCVYKTYGYGYIHSFFYQSDQLAATNREGRFCSIVAVDDRNGVVMGHCGLKPSFPGSKSAEIASTCVKPEYRGQDVMNDMSVFRLNHAKKLGFKTLYSHMVAPHPASQKASLKIGFREAAVVIGASKTKVWKGFSAEFAKHRTSFLNGVYFIEPLPPATIFVPERHRGIVEKLMKRLERDVRYGEPEPSKPTSADFLADFGLNTVAERAEIVVKKITGESADRIHDLRRKAGSEGAKHVSLALPLADPFVPWLVGELEKHDFFFSGVHCDADFGDQLLLQHNTFVYDYTQLSLATDLSWELANHVQACDPNR